jgi:hypothetical protein
MRTLVFIDYWNFQLNWNTRTGGARCDWNKLGPEVLNHVNTLLAPMGLGPAQLEGVRLYASTLHGDPGAVKMLNWINSTLKRIPGWSVFMRERHLKPKSFRCRACGHTLEQCPACQVTYRQAPEKGVDSAIVSDMLTLAWEGSYDLAVLLSQDADFIPAVQAMQKKGFKVVNAGWSAGGNQLQQECWASFPLDAITSQITRA